MAQYEIQDSKPKYEAIPAGNYQADFLGMKPVTLENNGSKVFRWEFKIVDGEHKGKTISELSDADKPPTVKNKTGRFLAQIANTPLAAGTKVDPDSFIGKRYLVIVFPKDQGKTKIEAFSQIPTVG